MKSRIAETPDVLRVLRPDFDDATRQKGADYLSQGRVKLVEVGPRKVIASVIGTRRYDVSVRIEDSDIDYFCSCPRFRDGFPCKHVWAVVLALNQLNLRRPDPAARERKEAPSGWKNLVRKTRAEQEERGVAPDPQDVQIIYRVDPREARNGGGFVVHVSARRRATDGTWSRPDWAFLPSLDADSLPDPADRALLSLLYAGDEDLDNHFERPTSFNLHPVHLELLLPLLGRTGRLHLLNDDAQPAETPSTWDDGEPWALVLRIEGDKDLRVWGRFERAGSVLDLREPALILAEGFLFARSTISRFKFSGPFEWIRDLRRDGPLAVPASEAGDFLAELHRLPGALPVEIPEALKFAEVRVPPQATVSVTAKRREYDRRPDRLLPATVKFDYLGCPTRPFIPGERLVDAAARRIVIRDRGAEAKLLESLVEAGFRKEPDYRKADAVDFEIDAMRLPRAVPRLIEAGWRVEADGLQYRPPGKFRLEVVSGMDWFDLKGGVEFGDEVVPFPALLKAARRGDRHVVLGDGSFGLLPEEWLRRSGIVLGSGKAEGDALRFRPGQAMLLDALLAAEDRAVADPGFQRARREMRSFDSLTPGEPPKGFFGELRPYQKLSLGWFDFLRRFGWGGCLADDMGLGKTVQALALLAGRRGKRSLVVVPRSLIFNWKSEAARFAPGLKVVEHGGLDRVRDASAFKGADIVLTTYGILRRDAPFLKDVAFDYVILDEAQAIKNASGATAKAARLLKGEHRLAMSGTPIENHLGELWSLMEFLNPGLLGAASVFRSASGADEEARRVLARALRPFILRRTKEQVAPELPARIEQTVTVDLDPEERRRYDELKEHYRRTLLDGGDFRKSKFHALEALLRLRQAACHGGLIDPKLVSKPGTKLEVLIERLREIADEGHKALVFSQFTSLLAILKAHLDKAGMTYEYLDGATRDREARVKRFQSDAACPFFLISLKAGGLGLNLTAAEYVFLLDPWWNPAAEAQAIDRAHRIGQDKAVMAMRIVARDTVEERVIELQRTKRALAEAILSADGGPMRGLTREDLALLLS
ncbi:MAG TPA: SNF2-related protein [Planctomycetota bacterium]|jgi:superfamily II DNA or RNA helicase